MCCWPVRDFTLSDLAMPSHARPQHKTQHPKHAKHAEVTSTLPDARLSLPLRIPHLKTTGKKHGQQKTVSARAA